MRVTVTEATQINHDGQVYGPGDTFDAPTEDAERYVAEGWAVKAQPKSTKRGRQG